MTIQAPGEPAWVAAAVQELDEAGSWTGRMHIHKLLFVAQVLGLADPPFEFELYQYGPYSFDLDHWIAELDAYGYLRKTYPQPGYGPKYGVTDLGKAVAAGIGHEEIAQLRKVAQSVGGLSGKDLELRATCLWAERRENIDDDKAIVTRVRNLKPRYSLAEIEHGLGEARALAVALTPETP